MRFCTSGFFQPVTYIFILCVSIFSPLYGKTLQVVGTDVEASLALSQYGPTSSTDTLWGIAQKVKPDNRLSIYQVMAAIFNNNPHAFNSNNYNSLEKGMILAIPSFTEMRSLPLSKAESLAKNNDNSWEKQPTKSIGFSHNSENSKDSISTNTVSLPFKVKPNTEIITLKAELSTLEPQIEILQTKNLGLTDELARTLDQLEAIQADNRNLKVKLAELSTLLLQAETSLQISLKNNKKLNENIKFLEMEIKELKAMQSLTPGFMANPWVIAIAGLILVLGVFSCVFWYLKRKSAQKESQQEQPPSEAEEVEDTEVSTESISDENSEADSDAHAQDDDDNQGNNVVEADDNNENDATDDKSDNASASNTDKIEVELESNLSVDSLWDETSSDFIDDLDENKEEQKSDNDENDIDADEEDITAKAAELDGSELANSDEFFNDDKLDAVTTIEDEEQNFDSDEIDNLLEGAQSQAEQQTESELIASAAVAHDDSEQQDDAFSAADASDNEFTDNVEKDFSQKSQQANDDILDNLFDEAESQAEIDIEFDADAELETNLGSEPKVNIESLLNKHQVQQTESQPSEIETNEHSDSNNLNDGFIDVDSLLQDAENEDEVEDKYKRPNPRLEDSDDIVMVDVDDAENSISAKLDLARAYIEIDDHSNAKALLETVLLDGNSQQQQEATKLLASLNI